MRALGIGFGIVALVVSGGAAAQGKEAKPARRVQLITMTAPGPESRPDAAAEPPSVPTPVSTGARPPDFRVHDLSRRYIGRASGGERGCTDGYISVGAVTKK